MANNIQSSGGSGSTSGIDTTPVVSIFPTDYNFFYQFGSSASLPSQAMNVSYENATNVSIQIEITYLQGNGWVTIPPVDSSGNTQVSVDPTGFAVGNYMAEVRAKLIDNGTGDVVATSSPAVVRLSVSDADFLSIVPTTMVFSHMLGQTLPASQSVQLDSSQPWTASIDTNAYPDVLDVTPTSGSSGSGQSLSVALKSAIDNQSVGQVQIPVVFSSGSLSKTLNVTINIEQPAGGFSVAPNIINIEWLRGSALPNDFIINVFSDDDWEITSKPSWLYINQMSGSTSASLEGNVIGITSIPQGNYTGTITFVYNGQNFNVIVNLSVFDFLNTTLYNGGYFFTHNDDVLKFHSNRDDTFIEITLNARIYLYEGGFNDVEKKFKLPLFKRKNEFHPGMIVHQLIDELEKIIEYINNKNGGAFFYPKITSVDLEIKENDYEGIEYFSANLYSLKYLKGKKPASFPLLMENPLLSRIYEKNKIQPLAIFFETQSVFSIDYFGVDHFSQQSFSNIGNELYSVYFVDLTDNIFNNLVKIVGNNNSFEKKYIILDETDFLTKIIFINSFGLEEWIEFSGKYEVINDPVKKENKTGKFLYEEKTNFLIENKAKIKLNTGKIFAHELPVIVCIMNLPYVWLSYDDKENVKVRCLTKKIVTKPYDDGMVSLDLEFEIIENTNDTIY